MTARQVVDGVQAGIAYFEKYEKKHWEWNVEITAEGVEGEEEDPTCIITGMGLDEDGDLRNRGFLITIGYRFPL